MNREEDTRANLEQRGISDTNLLKILAWDSSFFGYAVGTIAATDIHVATINKIIDEARRKDVKLLYLFMDASDKVSQHSAETVEAKLVDKKVTFSLKIEDAVSERDNHIELLTTDYPSEKLIQLAIQSGLYSRYKIDSNFKNNEFEKLYTMWIINSVNKKIADYTFVYKEEGVEVGLVTLKLGDNDGQIGLMAVDENSRGRSIGKKLVYAVIGSLKDKNIDYVHVPTQEDNKVACKFYRSIGFEEIKTESIYHIWL